MFLVQISKNLFLDAEKISEIILFETEEVHIYLQGSEERIEVQEEYVSSALNHIQALQNNVNNIESYYRKLTEENTNDK